MLFRVISIFPDIISSYMQAGVLGRALKNKKIRLETIDPRSFTNDKHKSVDDTPYGGGAGMVMKFDPLYRAFKSFRKTKKQKVILLSAKGKQWNQQLAKKYAASADSLVFICGRYEGVDERILEFVDEEISLGNFVLTGGELPALAIMDSVARLLPKVLGNAESLASESHSEEGVLEYPQYTKPEIISLGKKKLRVPKILLSGNHAAIAEWREKHSKKLKKARK